MRLVRNGHCTGPAEMPVLSAYGTLVNAVQPDAVTALAGPRQLVASSLQEAMFNYSVFRYPTLSVGVPRCHTPSEKRASSSIV